MEKIKKSDIFETVKHSKNYFLANIATKAVAVISIPIFTRLLTQADYGIVAVFNAYVGIFLVVLSLNAHASVGRYYYEKSDDFGEFIGTSLIFVGIVFGLTVFIFALLYRQIGNLIQLPGLLPIYLILVCLFAILSAVYLQILVPQKKSKEAAIIKTVKGYTLTGTAILFVCLLEENKYLGRIWANLLISFIFSIYFMMKIRRYWKFSFKSSHLKYIANYSFPLIPYSLSGVILAQFDRIMINSTLDATSTGLYSLGYNIGMLLLITIESTRQALVPDFFKFLDNKEYRRLDALVKRVFSIVTVAALGLVLFAREMGIILADEKFHPGLGVVPVVVIGYVFYGMFTVYSRYIHYEKRTTYLSIVVLVGGILNIILNALFIPRYGYIAAAYTTLASYFILFLLAWVVARMVFSQGITPLRMIWDPTIIMFLFIAFAYYLNELNLNVVLFLIIKLTILIVFGIAVFWRETKILYSEMCNK